MNNTYPSPNFNDAIFRSLFETAPSGLLICDYAELKIVHVNNTASKILGYTTEEFLKHNLDNIIPEINIVKRFLKKDEVEIVSEIDVEFRLKNSKRIELKTNVFFAKDDVENTRFIALQIYPLEEDRINKTNPDANLENCISLLNAFDGAAMLIDLDCNIKIINKAMANRYGLAIEELTGRNSLELLPQKTRNERALKIQSAIASKSLIEFIDTRDGKILHNTIRPLFNDKIEVESLAIFSVDLSENAELQHQLKLKNFLVDESLNGVALADLEGKLIYVNKSFLQMWRIENQNEIIGKLATGFWKNPDDAQKVINTLFEKGTYEGDLLAIRGDQTEAVFQLSSRLINDNTNSPIAMMASFVDISLQRKAELEHQESEALLKSVVEALPVGLRFVNKDGKLISSNKVAREIWNGDSSIPLIEDPNTYTDRVWSFESGLPIKPKEWGIFKAIRTKETFHKEIIKILSLDGKTKFINCSAAPIFDKENEIIGGLSVSEDITDKVLAETNFFQSKQQLNTVVSNAPFILFSINKEGLFTLSEGRALELLGLKAGEVVGVSAFEMYKDYPIVIDYLNKALNGEKVTFSFQLDALYFEAVYNPLFDTQGEVIGVTGFGVDTTQQELTRKSLLENEARLLDAQRIAKLGYWELDLKTQKLWWSDEQYVINGIIKKDEQVSQNEFISLLHPDDREAFFEKFNILISTTDEVGLTYRIIRPDGQVRVIYGVAHSTFHPDGTPNKISGVNQDITEKVRAEEALKESEQNLKRAQRVAKIGSWKLDIRQNILEWSDETYLIFGVPSKAPLSYEQFLLYVHPEDREHLDLSWKEAVKGAPYNMVHRIIVNGQIKWVQEHGEITYDKERNPISCFGTVQDITDQKLLQETNLIFNRAQLFSGLGSWRWTLNNNEVFWSDNVYNLLNIDKETSKASIKSFFKAIYHEDRKQVRKKGEECVHNKAAYEVEYRVKLSNQNFRWLMGSGNVLTDKDGSVIEVYGIIRDITKERMHTEELTEAKKQADEANFIKDQFLSVMSHEIRTPLNAVIGLSHILLKREPREDQLEIIRTLKSSADNLLHLANDILDFNKIRAGKLELENVRFNPISFLQQLHSSFKLEALEKGIEFVVQADSRIPNLLMGDITRLHQIFNNLLSNAVKFTHHGNVKFEVRVLEFYEDRCSLIFEISDTGVGIAPEKHEIIFQPFHQSELAISRKYGGTGLGLSIVKSLVEKMNGKITLLSDLNKGSQFSIELTFDFPSDEVSSKNYTFGSTHIKEGDSQGNSNFSVLYVEDVDSNRFLIENILSDHAINCISVSSGMAALHFTTAKKFDVILMDLQMPQMNGYEVTQDIRNQKNGLNRNTPILAFTAEIDSETLRQRLADNNIQDLITKPFEVNLLIEKLKKYKSEFNTSINVFTFEYYQGAFSNNKDKLENIKKVIIKDLEKLDKKLVKAVQLNDIESFKQEVHTIRPIVKKLGYTGLLDLLEKLKTEFESSKSNIALLANVSNMIGNLIEDVRKA